MATLTDISYLSAWELVDLYARRLVSPVEVALDLLARVERFGAALNPFVLVDGERALAAARASEARWWRGEPAGVVDGVPVSIKDLLLTRGWPTRRGSLTTTTEGVWEEDAPAVARLREQGAVLFAKTTTSEFGLKGLGDSPLTGITRNPWDPSRSPGGSSAGAAAAVAAGFGPIAVATDGGGSIRVPSAFTGVVGLKPTFGRVPTYPAGVIGVPPVVGPITRSVRDAAMVLTVIAGADDRDPFRLPADGRDYGRELEEPLAGLTLGASATLGYASVDSELRNGFERSLSVLQTLGAKVVECDPGFDSPEETVRILFAARAAWTVQHFGAEQRAMLDPVVATAALAGEQLSTIQYLRAESERVALAQAMASYHRRFDLLVTPTTARAAPLAEGEPDGSGHRRSPFAAAFSLTRQPAISVPVGRTSEGLPIGLQIVGRHFEDALVLRAARAIETRLPFVAPPIERLPVAEKLGSGRAGPNELRQ
jgi:aspartyl-tRNA(Asn)/glutamyl-tRNA(Gln) amidotransferase subunit A